jgi:transposase InsO family protein
MNALYRSAGISKQAVDQYNKRQITFDEKVGKLILEADELRAEHPGCGVEKIYYTLKPDFIGRDRFIELFMSLGYRLKQSRKYHRTTYSSRIYYPNLIKGMEVNHPSKVWQTDITYIEVNHHFYYAVFIIDVYTRKIVGYKVSDHLRAKANMEALRMAFKHHRPPLVHHSDRGSQYIYSEYIELLNKNNCMISMGLKAQDNAYAERLHKTIKEEYLDYWKPQTFNELKRQIKKAVKNYNERRIHNEITRLTPNQLEKLHANNRIGNSFNVTIFKENKL